MDGNMAIVPTRSILDMNAGEENRFGIRECVVHGQRTLLCSLTPVKYIIKRLIIFPFLISDIFPKITTVYG